MTIAILEPNPWCRLARSGAQLAIASLLGLFADYAMSGDVQDTNRKVVQQAFSAWSAGTGGPYDLLAPDATWTITGNSLASKTYRSREEFLSQVIRPFNARMRNRLIPTIRNIYAEGDTVVVFFDAAGTALDGNAYKNTYAWFLELRNERIVNAHAFFDSIAFNEFWTRTGAMLPAETRGRIGAR